MTNTLKYSLAVLALIFSLVSCSSDDSPAISGQGELTLEFDQAYAGNDLILGAAQPANTQGESIRIDAVKYIVSNIVLTKDDGTTYVYPKSESHFIVDETDETTHEIELHDIPAGNYTKVTFGIGADQQQYDLGEDAQGNFAAAAQAAGLLADWEEGYRFFAMSGSFTSPSVSADTPFDAKTRKTPNNYNYLETTLDFPTKALVRENIAPVVHLIADMSKTFAGMYPVKLADHVSGGSAVIADDVTISAICVNLNGAFSVNHIHNEPHEH